MRWDVVVIGAGAAGLLAAARAAERGRRTLLLEKNRRPGVKILMSGGTRCNLTHATDARGIVEAYGPPGRFLHSALAALGPDDLVNLIEVEGVPTKVEETGKIFPVSNRATDVLAALLRRLERSGAVLAPAEPVRDLKLSAAGFHLTTPSRSLLAEKVILTTGGQSYPGSGTTGDGYRWARELGHTIVPPRPALVPITVSDDWVKALQGVTLTDVLLRVLEPGLDGSGDHCLAQRRGSFLFTHFGLSGPSVLDVSRVVSGHPQPATLKLACDFLPQCSAAELDDTLRREAAQSGKKLVAGILAERIPRRLVDQLVTGAGLPLDRRCATLTRQERSRLIELVKDSRLGIRGTLGYEKAEVTAGGVSLAEVDSRTLESKIVPNLYLAGEILDLDGPIGGYNFQAAFSTGWLAGESV